MYSHSRKDVVVIGAGFFGCALVQHLQSLESVGRVTLIDKSHEPLSVASRINQARIHNGYHYPRSLSTAFASHRRYAEFKRAWPSAVFSNFDHTYAIARHGSNVSANQFRATMEAIGAPVRVLGSRDKQAFEFEPRFIDTAFRVQEEAFNYLELRTWAYEVLDNSKTTYLPNESVARVAKNNLGNTEIFLESGTTLSTDFVFNVTYAGIEAIDGISGELSGRFRYEKAAMVLVSSPNVVGNALTVMDGPFFSLMPYPAVEGAHTFSHVEYTPYLKSTRNPREVPELTTEEIESQIFRAMRLDAAKYVPCLEDLEFEGALQTTKVILQKSDLDDSRPILFYRHSLENCYSILGGKLDNVFEMIDYMKKEVDL